MSVEAEQTGAPCIESGSFRDPSGFLFWQNGTLLRQVNLCFKDHYDFFMESGLCEELQAENFLIKHEEVPSTSGVGPSAYKTLKPEYLPFISYPYEWSFSQLKDAALLTLTILEKALNRGMILKDATAFNTQFRGTQPILIDTLSFEKYQPGLPWIAYKQFCEHFLAPLALMSYCDIRMSSLSHHYINGIPLDLTSRLLPHRTWLHPTLLLHVHLHAKSQKSFGKKQLKPKRSSTQFTLKALLGLADNLRSAVTALKWRPGGTEWGEYYNETNYSSRAMSVKEKMVLDFVTEANPKPNQVWDLGANTGLFSKAAASTGAYVISADVDPAAVEKNYLSEKAAKSDNILPLLMDLSNPSPMLGWANEERRSLLKRGPADLVLALALIHHLAISNNVPLERLANFFAECGRHLVIEFVPKNDSQVQRLLSSRSDIFPNYTEMEFEKVFSVLFAIERKQQIAESSRILYLMKRRGR